MIKNNKKDIKRNSSIKLKNAKNKEKTMSDMSRKSEKSVSRIDSMRNEKLRRKEWNGTKNVVRNAEMLRNVGVKMLKRGKKSVLEQSGKRNCSIIANIRTSPTVFLINTRASTFLVILKLLLLNSNYQTRLNSSKILTLSLNHVLRLKKTMKKNKNKRRMLSILNIKNIMTKKRKRKKLIKKKRKDNTRLSLK